MVWKPKPWAAATLGLFAAPLAFLYIGRGKLAMAWLTAILLAAAAVLFGGFPAQGVEVVIAAASVGVAAFAYRQARTMAAFAVRPAVSTKRFMAIAGLCFVLAAFLLRAVVVEPFSIPSTSMTPTLVPGDRILVAKWGYGHYSSYGLRLPIETRFAQLRRGDVIVFEFPRDQTQVYVQRVIGVAGDRLTIRNSQVSLNGAAAVLVPKGDFLDDSKLEFLPVYEETLGGRTYSVAIGERKAVRNEPNRHCTVAADESMDCIVPAGHYFMMGDNRENAFDSRSWGMLNEKHLVGKLVRTFH